MHRGWTAAKTHRFLSSGRRRLRREDHLSSLPGDTRWTAVHQNFKSGHPGPALREAVAQIHLALAFPHYTSFLAGSGRSSRCVLPEHVAPGCMPVEDRDTRLVRGVVFRRGPGG